MKAELQYQAVRIINVLVKKDENWLPQHQPVATNLLRIWISDMFAEKHKKVDSMDYVHWKEPKLIVKCLLNFFK
jgi:transformation/transcription domain-associated protein